MPPIDSDVTWADVIAALVRNGFSLSEVGGMRMKQVELIIKAIDKANSPDSKDQPAEVTPDKDGWF